MGAIKERRLALRRLKEVIKDPSTVFVIHYSQLKLHDADSNEFTPLISAIVVKSLDKNREHHFAIHLEADKAGIPLEEIENSYRDLELRTLKSFNEFVRRHKHYKWIHWEMKNVHFGFEAIRHRFDKIFNGLRERFEEIPANNKFNLCSLLEGMYGEAFVSKPDKLASLLKCNNDGVLSTEYLSLEYEAVEFEKKNFHPVLASLDCKVDFIIRVVRMISERDLTTESRNGYAIFTDLVNHPITVFVGYLVGIIGILLTIFL